jgi:nucleotide-binding universal stress UspA family protein
MLDIVVEQLDTSNISFEKIVLVGEVYEQIINHAKEENFDLIVMGPKGIDDHKYSVVGSVTKKVIAESHCPILLIKE